MTIGRLPHKALFILFQAAACAFAAEFPLTDWEFVRGDSDEGWQKVTVPHDWAIWGEFDREIDKQTVRVIEDGETKAQTRYGRSGCLPWIGVGRYRRTVELPEGTAFAELVFDGAMSHARVSVNGKQAGAWERGYNSFAVDLTPFLPARKLDVLVRLNNLPESSRWYPGAGLIRPVTLRTGGAVGLTRWGTYVRTTRLGAGGSARVAVTTSLRGATERTAVAWRILDAAGACVASAERPCLGETSHFFELGSPRLWTPETPYLYTLETTAKVDGKAVDSEKTRFGVRTVEWRNGAFELNGVVRKINGVCMHHDLGPIGAAFNAAAFRRQVRLLKSIGCDAIRTAHNMPAPGQTDICDEMGMMVMAESFDEWTEPKCKNGYHHWCADWWRRDLSNLVRRHRNHPSVVMWSIGNEITDQRSAIGTELSRAMQDLCHDLDPSRPVTQGHSWMPRAIETGGVQVMDIPGVTYRLPFYADLHKASRFGGVLGAETASTVSSRGWYAASDEPGWDKTYASGQSSGYDVEYAPWSNLPDDDWAVQEDNAWTMGEFVWTGFDYLGEPYPYDKTGMRSSYFGIFDLAGLPKDRVWLYKSHWKPSEPTLHIVPSHWNFAGREKSVVPVHVYTSYPSAELFVNGKSYGRKTFDKASRLDRFRLRWRDVVYEPGTVEAVAYDASGKEAMRTRLVTAGEPARLVLEADRSTLSAAGDMGTPDLAFVTVKVVDKNGDVCPHATPALSFKVTGAASYRAACNGDATSYEKLSGTTMKAFGGMLVVVVEAGRTAGNAELEVTAPSLPAAKIGLTVSK